MPTASTAIDVRYCLDTNILVYAADTGAGDRHGRASLILSRLPETGGVITLQSLGEFFRVQVYKRKLPVPAARRWIDALRQSTTIVAADEACLAAAMEAVEDHRWSFWDAMIWATARKAGCRLLLTEDGQDGRTLGGVTLVNPFLPNPSPLLVEALGPFP